MFSLLLTLIFTTIVIISYQDFTSRSVSSILFPVILILGIFWSLSGQTTIVTIAWNTLINSLFLFSQFLLLKFYFHFRNDGKKLINKKIGLGDILFIVACTVYFSPLFFILFYCLSLIASLLFYILWQLLFKRRQSQPNIPLAGIQAIFLFCFILLNHYSSFATIVNDWLLHYV